MALMDRAVLELTVDGTTGHFHFVGTDVTEELDREFLMGQRGQAIREVVDVVTGDDGDSSGQEGYYADAGQGTDTITLSFEGGHDRDNYNSIETTWGDGSSGIDRWDATGAHPVTMAQVLNWWARNARTDSFRSQARLHWGEWTDGSIGGEAGIFGEPITVVVQTVRAERDDSGPSSFEGTVELVRASSINDGDATEPVPDY